MIDQEFFLHRLRFCTEPWPSSMGQISRLDRHLGDGSNLKARKNEKKAVATSLSKENRQALLQTERRWKEELFEEETTQVTKKEEHLKEAAMEGTA